MVDAFSLLTSPSLCRRFMVIERRILVEGWKSLVKLKYRNMAKEAIFANAVVYTSPHDPIKVGVIYGIAVLSYFV